MRVLHSSTFQANSWILVAIFPLVAGAIFDAKGIKTLPYVNIPLAATMACLWTLFPSREPARR